MRIKFDISSFPSKLFSIKNNLINAFESKFANSAVSDFKSNINAVSPLLLCYPEFFMIISYAQSFSISYGLYLHIYIVIV